MVGLGKIIDGSSMEVGPSMGLSRGRFKVVAVPVPVRAVRKPEAMPTRALVPACDGDRRTVRGPLVHVSKSRGGSDKE